MAEDADLVEVQRDIILDPFDPGVIKGAKESDISDDWIDAAQRSPVYKIVNKMGTGFTASSRIQDLAKPVLYTTFDANHDQCGKEYAYGRRYL